MLFQWDLARNPVDQILSTFWETLDEPEDIREFANALFCRTVENIEQIDTLIRRHAEHWRLDRMATVDRNLLRLATQEFLV